MSLFGLALNLERSLQDGDLMVGIFLAGSLVGFYSLVLDPPELDLMFISDEHQGKGLGRKLIESLKFEAKMRDIKSLKIVSHPPAEKFYLSIGATKIGQAEPSERIPWPRPVFSLII